MCVGCCIDLYLYKLLLIARQLVQDFWDESSALNPFVYPFQRVCETDLFTNKSKKRTNKLKKILSRL